LLRDVWLTMCGMNEKNLVPLNKRSQRERKEIQAKGAFACAESKRRKRDMASLVSAMMDSQVYGETAEKFKALYPDLDEDATWASVMTAGQMKSASRGNTRAFQVLSEYKDKADAREDAKEAHSLFTADFGLLIGSDFLGVHRAVMAGLVTDVWLKGGRGSLKSSYVSLEIVYQLERHKDWHALVCMARKNAIKEAAFSQLVWACEALGVSEHWRQNTSPCKLTNTVTGQCIYFRGLDDPGKTKSIKPPFGYIALEWFEETDQLRGTNEIRTVNQSASRGGDDVLRFYSYNPPRSRLNWINKHILDLESATPERTIVSHSTWKHAPVEWLGAQFIEDALELKKRNQLAYAHEYDGESVGYGAQVFENVEVRTIIDEERKALDVRLFGVDWGFSTDPFVWIEVGYSRRTRTIYLLDEITGHGLTNTKSAELVLAKMGNPVYEAGYEPTGDRGQDSAHMLRDAMPYADVQCDCAEPKSIADYNASGIRAKKCPKQGAHDVRNSVRWLQDRDKIVVDPATCPLAAHEFELYEYDRTPDGEITSTMPDRDNHTIDAVRYACATLIADRSCI